MANVYLPLKCPYSLSSCGIFILDASSIPARSHTFEAIDHEIISVAILFPPLIQEGLLSVTRERMCTKHWLTAWSSLPRKKCGKMN